MKKAVALILILVLLVPPLSACSIDAQEINTLIYTYVIGVDKGVSDKLRFTIMLPSLKGEQSSSGGSGQDAKSSKTTVISIDCPTIYSGLNLVRSFLSREINYAHAKLFIVGEELAKQGIRPFMQGMRMTEQIRLSMHMIVVKGEAKTFIEAFEPATGYSIPRTMEGLINAVNDTGLIHDETYMEVLQDLKSNTKQASCILAAINDMDNLLPAGSEAEKKFVTKLMPGELARQGGNPIELIGAAVFRGDKLVGELNLGETRALLMIEGKYMRGAFTIPDPLAAASDGELFITIEAHKVKEPEINVLTGEKSTIDIKVFYEGTIRNQQSGLKYQTEELRPILEKAYAEYIAQGIHEAVSKCQSLGSDIFGFGEVASKKFWTIQEWESYGWFDKFKDAEVNIEASMIIRKTGTVVENKPIQGGE